MAEPKKTKKTSGFDPSKPETLRELEPETLISIICSLQNQNRQLSELLQSYLREKYGPKSDRFVDSGQLTLFDRPDEESEDKAPDREKKEGKKNSSRDRNPRQSNVPHVKIKVRQQCPDELICKCCGKTMVKVNEIIVHSRFDYQPSSVCIEDLVEDVFACPGCSPAVVSGAAVAEFSEETQPVETSATRAALAAEIARLLDATNAQQEETPPSQLIDNAVAVARAKMRQAATQIARCHASPNMLSYLVVCKYCDHLPLYRLEQMFARHGANIPRSTMCGWLASTVALLRPLYDLMHSKLLQCKVIWTDDTPVKVQVRKLKKNIKTGRIWVYIGDKTQPFNVFDYTSGRAREGPKKFLRGFKRYLQGDCFSGNEAICTENGATLVACNAHGRRYFVKALLNYKSKSEEALRVFGQLFEIERTAKELGLNSDEVKLMRQQEATPIWNNFKKWLDEARLVALPKSAFGKAVGYCLNNWEALTSYLEDGNLSIDNNVAEQQMKTVAIGRKSWLFFGSDNGGENAEVLMSIISTCKRHNVEPWAYLRDVINSLIQNPDTNLEELLPHTWHARATKVETAA